MTALRFYAVALCALGTFALAEDPSPKKYDLRAPERWEAGEVVTETAVDEASISVKQQRDGGAAPQMTRRVSRSEWQIVRRCDEVATDGSPTRMLVHVTGWKSDRDGDVDKSLEGAFVLTTREGWTLLTPSTRPSPSARRWLDDRCGARPRRSDLSDLAPESPVAVGESWAPAPGSPLDDVARGRQFPVRLPEISDRATLVSVAASRDGERVNVNFDAKGALAGDLKTRDGGTLTVDDGEFALHASAEGVPERWRRSGRASLTGSVTLRSKQGDNDTTIEASFQFEHESVVGGEMPTPPAREAASGTRHRFAHDPAWKTGDTVTETARTDVSRSETPVSADGKTGETTTRASSTSWTVVRRCVESTPEGAPLRFVVWIKEWKSEEAGNVDTCLAATLVEVSARGISVQNPDVRPTPTAKLWLERTLGTVASTGSDDGMRGLVTPLAPMAAGESWAPDTAAMAAFLRAGTGFDTDGANATASATLTSAKVEGESVVATVDYRIHVPIPCVVGPDTKDAELKKGGAIDIEGTAVGAPATWTSAGEVAEETKLSVAVPGAGGGVRRVAMTQRRKRVRTPGGEIPAK